MSEAGNGQAAGGRVTLAGLIALAARVTGLSAAALTGPVQAAPVVAVRQALMALAYEQGLWSLAAIGRAIGGRDHATVIAGLRRAGLYPPREGKPGPDAAVGTVLAQLRAALAPTASPTLPTPRCRPETATLEIIVAETARAAGVTVAKIRSLRVEPRVSAWRHAGIALAARTGRWSMPAIGDAYNLNARAAYIAMIRAGLRPGKTGYKRRTQEVVDCLAALDDMRAGRRPWPPLATGELAPGWIAPPAALPPGVNVVEARDLRRKGWSVKALAARYDVPPAEIARMFGVAWSEQSDMVRRAAVLAAIGQGAGA